MTDLLKLIEAVDPTDDADLDEIDVITHNFLHDAFLAGEIPNYTRSIDAIVSIQPVKYEWFCQYSCGVYFATLHDGEKSGVEFKSPPLKSEPLARLHATIQAIMKERERR